MDRRDLFRPIFIFIFEVYRFNSTGKYRPVLTGADRRRKLTPVSERH